MILPVLLLLGVIGAARAQQPDTQSATASVEELSAEIAALKAKTSTWDKVLAALPKISGYVQTGYEWSDNSSTFFIKRVRLNLAGAIAPKLDYRVQIEFASPKIVDAYLCYKPFDELSLRKLMGFNDLCGLSATGRDMGAQLFGGFFKRDGYSILNYNFGVFNGEGLNVKDKNKSKDIVARLTVKPVAGLQFAGSYYWGEYGEDYLKRIRYGAGACYDYGRLVLRGEYICGTTGGLDSEGWYAVAGWRVARTLLPTVRYDTFLEDCSRGSSRQTNYTAGLTWQPVKYLRCQLDYTYEDFAARGVAGRNVVALMLSGIF